MLVARLWVWVPLILYYGSVYWVCEIFCSDHDEILRSMQALCADTLIQTCEQAIADHETRVLKCQLYVGLIGLVGGLFLIVAGEGAIQTAGQILYQIDMYTGKASTTSKVTWFPNLPVITQVMRIGLEDMAKHFRSRVAVARHNLKVPIAILRCHVLELQEQEPRPAIVQTRLKELVKQVSIIEEYVGLLDEMDWKRSRTEDFDLGKLLAEVVGDMSKVAANRNIKIEVEHSSDTWSALGNISLARQALLILLDNAVEHTKPGTTIFVWYHKCRSGVKIWICDNGPGLDPGNLRFFAGSAATSKIVPAPKGLGLQILAKICSGQRWYLDYQANKPVGSRVSLTIPLKGVVSTVKPICIS